VTADGIHIENSPDYHLLYARVLTDAIATLQRERETPSSLLIEKRDELLSAVTHQLQPNLTFPQFGDTENDPTAARLGSLLAQARRQALGDKAAYDELEWVLTSGAQGTVPGQLDRVFPEGGYAAFRSAWDPRDPQGAITAHFTCKRESKNHYHQDETSFEIYGYGQELIVDTGKYGYDKTDPFVRFQYAVYAHNVLTVDRGTYVPRGQPRITAHGIGRDLAWVRGTHDNWADRGVTSHVRTFAYAKPESFVVVDHLRAFGKHRYVQHFHLHPDVSEISIVNDNTFVATVPGGRGPTVVIAPVTPPDWVRMLRGVHSDALTQGWYFPDWGRAEAATDAIFRYVREGGKLEFPVVITITPPGQPPLVPTELSYTETSDHLAVAWTIAGRRRTVAIPLE
jgi:hypothetical protein